MVLLTICPLEEVLAKFSARPFRNMISLHEFDEAANQNLELAEYDQGDSMVQYSSV